MNTLEEIFYFKYHEQDGFALALYYHGGGNAGEYIRVPGYNVVINRVDHRPYMEQDDNRGKSQKFFSPISLCGLFVDVC